MTLADTPTTWVEGPSISTLETLAIFVGIPALIILTLFLLVYAPSWVKGPRYRPGQPWEAKSEWFGTPVEPAEQSNAALIGSSQSADATAAQAPAPVASGPSPDENAGGASAGW